MGKIKVDSWDRLIPRFVEARGGVVGAVGGVGVVVGCRAFWVEGEQRAGRERAERAENAERERGE